MAGYTVFGEYPLKTGGVVDILAKREDQVLAVEVETGKSDICWNIEKCRKAGIGRIVLAATSREARTKIEALLERRGLSRDKNIWLIEARFIGRTP